MDHDAVHADRSTVGVPARCPECGAATAGRRLPREGRRIAASLLTLALVGTVIVSFTEHRGLPFNGRPDTSMGGYAKRWTLPDVRAVRDGSQTGEELSSAFRACLAFIPPRAQGWTRVWPEFSDPEAFPTTHEALRLGETGFRPFLASELTAVLNEPDSDRKLAALLLGAMATSPGRSATASVPGQAAPYATAALGTATKGTVPDEHGYLRLTADLQSAVPRSRTDTWSWHGYGVAVLGQFTVLRESLFGEPTPASSSDVLSPVVVRWPFLSIHRAFGSPTERSVTLSLHVPAVLIGLASVVAIWIACWLAVGGWHVGRRRRRLRLVQCLACGHSLGPPTSAEGRSASLLSSP